MTPNEARYITRMINAYRNNLLFIDATDEDKREMVAMRVRYEEAGGWEKGTEAAISEFILRVAERGVPDGEYLHPEGVEEARLLAERFSSHLPPIERPNRCPRCHDNRAGKGSMVIDHKVFCNETCYQEWVTNGRRTEITTGSGGAGSIQSRSDLYGRTLLFSKLVRGDEFTVDQAMAAAFGADLEDVQARLGEMTASLYSEYVGWGGKRKTEADYHLLAKKRGIEWIGETGGDDHQSIQ